MSKTYRLTTEFFAIPYEDGLYLLYSPLKQLLMLANDEMVDLVADLRDGTFAGVDAANVDAMQLLIEAGAVNGTPDEPPRHRAAEAWKPTEVTLFLTNACNLRCTYCYASAGEYKGSMDLQTALSAVEVVAANALELKQDAFRVSYHGGGEPTLAWETLTGSAARAEQLAREHGLNVFLSLATNGALPSWKVDWLARHVHDFSISYDGPGYLQDKHRPTVSGEGSASAVEATFRHLDSHGCRYGIRITITEESVGHMAEIVDYVLERFSPGTVHVEPMFAQGRARTRGLEPPDARTFIDNFLRGQEIASRYGIDLYYSGARSELITDTFCGVPEGSFNVTPEGQLTSCFEVCHPEDALADQFFYGGLAPADQAPADSGKMQLPVLGTVAAATPPPPDATDRAGPFEVDTGKLTDLASHTVQKRPECENCFCKWHCAGDCIAKNMVSDQHPGENLKAARCIINQELTRHQLIARLKESSRTMRQVEASVAGGTPRPLEVH